MFLLPPCFHLVSPHLGSMKVLSRGPIIRWSLRTPKSGSVVSRNDWSAGRDISEEEQSAGLLLRIQDATRGIPHSNPLLKAVVKAQSSDFQINEVDAEGSIAVLEKAPKGKWRKVSRQKTIPVEDDSRIPFSDPSKTFSPRVQSYGEYVRAAGKLPRDLPVLRFVLYRDAYSAQSVENRLAYSLSLQNDSLCMHDNPGGSFGCLTQHGVCVGMTREFLPHASRHYNTHPLVFDPREYASLDSMWTFQRKPRGYYYRILLRCVDGDKEAIESRLRSIEEFGFLNYFGMDAFGIGTNRFFEMASFAEKGDFRRAVGSLLQSVAECDAMHHDYYLRYMNSDSSTALGITQFWADAAKQMRSQRWLIQVLEGLAAYHANSEKEGALAEVWKSVPFLDKIKKSAAEFVWNAMASQRVISKGLNVVEGDVLRVSSTSKTEEGSIGFTYRLATTQDVESKSFRITDVVLPIPYGSSAVQDCLFPHLSPLDRNLYEEFSAKHGIDFLFKETLHAGSTISPSEWYRPLVAKPLRLQSAVIHDPNSFTSLKSDIQILQERQPIETTHMSYTSRVREPCVYNVSERFVEKMGPIRQQNEGTNSVVVSCLLPSNSSPFVMLREVFSLRYASFQDLYGVL